MRKNNPLLNKKLQLERADVAPLETYSNPYHLRRDVHTFVRYVSERRVKRAHRSNQLPKADAKRLAKLMSHPDCLKHIQQEGYSWWLDAVDLLALRLGFVSYDTKGIYAGYSSQSPSFPDNYIEFNAQKYEKFLQTPLLEQETTLFLQMINDKGHNEFIHRDLHSSLSRFSRWESTTGVMPLLDFPQARRFLFRLLARLESGVWYTTQSLIRYLKENHPYFLIPEASKLPMERVWNQPPRRMKRYGNFREYKKGQGYYAKGSAPVPDDAPDGFERVEGRYVERFLEGFALTLGYVEVAYSKKPYQGLLPEWGTLPAFRVTERFLQFMRGEELRSKVTALPNFEVHVESPFYDPGLMRQLLRFAQPVADDRVTVLKLDKQRVKAALAADPDLDPVRWLHLTTGRPLPQNVAIELEEWVGQADAFVLYDAELALLEGNARLPEAAPFVVETIKPQLRLIRRPEEALRALQEAERIPLLVRHEEEQWAALPAKARTLFPKATKEKPKRQTRKRVVVQRETRLILYAPTADFYEQLRAELLQRRCIFEPDPARLAIAYAPAQKAQVDAALKALRQRYIIKFEDKT